MQRRLFIKTWLVVSWVHRKANPPREDEDEDEDEERKRKKLVDFEKEKKHMPSFLPVLNLYDPMPLWYLMSTFPRQDISRANLSEYPTLHTPTEVRFCK